MADVNNDPFGDHNKIGLHLDTGKNFPLTPRRAMGGSTWETESEQETSSGGGKLKKEGSLILTLTVCTRSYLSIIAELGCNPLV